MAHELANTVEREIIDKLSSATVITHIEPNDVAALFGRKRAEASTVSDRIVASDSRRHAALPNRVLAVLLQQGRAAHRRLIHCGLTLGAHPGTLRR
jgi:hypothetical protein